MNAYVKKIWTVPFLLLRACVLSASEQPLEYQPLRLKAMDCQVQVPVTWSVYDQSRPGAGAWVITPDDLTLADYKTGIKIDALAQVQSQTGVKASKWVAARVDDKSASLPVLGSETGPTNDYFQVRRLVTEEVYSPGRTEYATYRTIYTWYWNDRHDVVICMVARTPKKEWASMSAVLEKVGRLDVDVPAWEKKLATIQE
ncbi:MAG TPA: hypothetical protein PKM57_03870 [Kiritimatiellia bacterium]|nr:hypothetical protein [Kiritimatiellia bacterium]HPS07755.1 hypothetical protein [Kiritimatiellia bacterium]